jgi:hypothetical protein
VAQEHDYFSPFTKGERGLRVSVKWIGRWR